MNDYFFEFYILKYLNMYFLEEEIPSDFPFGTSREYLRPPPPSSGAKRGSPIGTGMNIIFL